jgi:hypothetical protein
VAPSPAGGAPAPVTPRPPGRVVYCADAVAWLEARPVLAGCSIVTSLPDRSDVPRRTFDEWRDWFVAAAALTMSRCPPDGVAVFYQTDEKRRGRLIDKAYLCGKAAEAAGHATLWHKIVCREPPGTVTYGRRAYSHLLCFAATPRPGLAGATADVLPRAGAARWERGMGVEACRVACSYVLRHCASRTVVDPFCGRGTVLAVANALGLDAVGVEIVARRAREARRARVALEPAR